MRKTIYFLNADLAWRAIHKPLSAGIQLAFLLGMIIFSVPAKALPPGLPPGPYRTSCRGTSVAGTELRSTCKDFFGNFRETRLENYAACTGQFKDVNGINHDRTIFNVDGTLRCILSRRERTGKYDSGSLFDMISIIKQQPGLTIWRIDRPEVWSNQNNGEVAYPMITFQPGDQVRFHAGGCVQTGGTGPTWKSYVNPQGGSADLYYEGTVSIPAITSGAFSKISSVIQQGTHTIPNAPAGADPKDLPKNILKLGYLDNQLDDNGYYKHDDGNYDQCKNIGPAFVEITVVNGTTTGALLSPHSRPFDLVWDMNGDEDENELPMNPQWNFTLERWAKGASRGEQPHFLPICGKAFNSPSAAVYHFDPNLFAQICSSMSPEFDEVFRGGAICHGHPIPGHLNFGIATYIGRIAWDSFGDTDNDWSFNIWRADGAGLAGEDEGPSPADALHVEFDARELPLPIIPFWQDTVVGGPAFFFPNANLAKALFDPGNPKGPLAVAIGEFGLDGVHGAPSEIHPLFALAIRTEHGPVQGEPGQMRERWVFFLRNSGDEGYCSGQEWLWPDKPAYFVSLPWPDGATELITHDDNVVGFQDAGSPGAIGIEVNKAQRFSLIRVGKPAGANLFGAGGTFDLFYKVPAPPKQKRAPVRTAKAPALNLRHGESDEEIAIKSLGSRITDPAVRAKFEAEVNALPPMTAIRFTKTARLAAPKTIIERKHVPGAASKGILTRARPVPNLAKQRWEVEAYKVMKTYQPHLKIEMPATPPKVATEALSK